MENISKLRSNKAFKVVLGALLLAAGVIVFWFYFVTLFQYLQNGTVEFFYKKGGVHFTGIDALVMHSAFFAMEILALFLGLRFIRKM
jgi:hypothetical protein